MTRIQRIVAREVLDSRGSPTIEVEAIAGAHWGRAIVPSGASTGRWEAHELRDGDQARYDGLGVQRAVEHVRREIAPVLMGADPCDQAAVDAVLLRLDGTPRKDRLGANALLGTSLATAHLAAAVRGIPLYQHFGELYAAGAGPAVAPRMPLPMTNVISGGLHAGGNLDFQDILVVPDGAPRYAVGLEWIVRIYRRLGRRLTAAGYDGRLVGDEGGYGPRVASLAEALDLVLAAIDEAGLVAGDDVSLALDVAATHFYREGHYHLRAAGDQRLTPAGMIDELEALIERYPITWLEDALAEDDWSGWQQLTQRLGGRVQLVGDDLFVTNPERLARGIGQHVASAVLVKLNQVGTVSETLDTMRLAARHGYARVVSARSGETEDTTIADLAVGTAAEMIKIGSVARSERLAKYNRLLRIEAELRGQAE